MIITKPLLASNINAMSINGAKKKRSFHRAGLLFLEELAKELELPEGSYEIRSNKGGAAVSGEVILHHNCIYIQLYESVGSRGIVILYRSCKGRADYTGGPNNYVSLRDLKNPVKQAEFLAHCRRLIHDTN